MKGIFQLIFCHNNDVNLYKILVKIKILHYKIRKTVFCKKKNTWHLLQLGKA